MRHLLNRSTLIGAGLAVAVIAVLAVIAGGSKSTITKARLERNLPTTFSRLYVQQAALLGHKGITVQSLRAKASCDKGGPDKPDIGPGSDWICLMSFQDPNVPLPDGSAKFEVNAHSNDCYTAGGPSKYVGSFQIADVHGKQVDNPVFEFDSCFAPNGSDAPTGVDLTTPQNQPTPAEQAAAPAALTLPTGTMAADGKGVIAPGLSCSAGKDGCAGTLTASVGGTKVETKYVVGPDDMQPVALPLPKGTTGTVTLTAAPVIGTAPHPTSTFEVR